MIGSIYNNMKNIRNFIVDYYNKISNNIFTLKYINYSYVLYLKYILIYLMILLRNMINRTIKIIDGNNKIYFYKVYNKKNNYVKVIDNTTIENIINGKDDIGYNKNVNIFDNKMLLEFKIIKDIKNKKQNTDISENLLNYWSIDKNNIILKNILLSEQINYNKDKDIIYIKYYEIGRAHV